MYREHWKPCIGLVRHMWRFYVLHPNANQQGMNAASRKAWTACDVVWSRMCESDRAIIRMYHVASKDLNELKQTVPAYAAEHHTTPERIMRVVTRAWRDVAIERGIADE